MPKPMWFIWSFSSWNWSTTEGQSFGKYIGNRLLKIKLKNKKSH